MDDTIKIVELNENNVRSFLNKLKDKKLIEHYSFVEEIKCSFKDASSVSSFIKSTRSRAAW